LRAGNVKTETQNTDELVRSISILEFVLWFRQSMSVFKQHPIEIEHDGQSVFATYSTWAGLVTVNTARGTETTEICDTPPRALARLMLREMAQDGKA
jgi:hypothetical protein